MILPIELTVDGEQYRLVESFAENGEAIMVFMTEEKRTELRIPHESAVTLSTALSYTLEELAKTST